MGLFKNFTRDIKARDEAFRKAKEDAEKASQMTSEQLIMAMILELDAAQHQILCRHPLGDEAIKRCDHDPYLQK